MKSFWVVTGFVILTCVLCAAEAAARGGASTVILGMPAFGAGTTEPAWLTAGGSGVIVLGAGYGVIVFGVYGLGILFATGQLAAGLIAFGQLAGGLLFYVAQLGFGITGVGQLAVGVGVAGQGTLGGDGEEFLKRMSADLDEILCVWERRPARPAG